MLDTNNRIMLAFQHRSLLNGSKLAIIYTFQSREEMELSSSIGGMERRTLFLVETQHLLNTVTMIVIELDE